MLVALECGDRPEAWEALGFTLPVRVGTVDVLLDGRGGGIRAWHLAPLMNKDPHADLIHHCPPTEWVAPRDAPPGERDLDHVVVLTGALDDTIAALVACGGDLRRRRDDLHSPMAFIRFGPVIVEVVQSEGPARIWGLVAVVDDLSELPADLVGEPRAAVQQGRQIVTVKREAGLGTALAFMTPRPSA